MEEGVFACGLVIELYTEVEVEAEEEDDDEVEGKVRDTGVECTELMWNGRTLGEGGTMEPSEVIVDVPRIGKGKVRGIAIGSTAQGEYIPNGHDHASESS